MLTELTTGGKSMKNINSKTLLTLLLFSLFIFFTPVVDASFIDLDSQTQTVLELEEDIEAEEDNTQEVKNFFFMQESSLCMITANKFQELVPSYPHTFQTNTSLFKPPNIKRIDTILLPTKQKIK